MNVNSRELVRRFLENKLDISYAFGDSTEFEYGQYQQVGIEGESVHIFILFNSSYQQDIVDVILRDFEGVVIIMTESWMRDKKWIHMLESLVEYMHEKYL